MRNQPREEALLGMIGTLIHSDDDRATVESRPPNQDTFYYE